MAQVSLGPCSFAATVKLSDALGVSSTVAQVLVRRGLGDLAAARAFLDAEECHSPIRFEGIERVVGLIGTHIRAGTQITVHGDYDCDGVCSTAVLVRVLRSLGADVDWYLPDRRSDGYGLAAHTVERLASRGTRLLICVDCAITAVEEVAAARAAGVDVVVCDHHAPRADGRLPDAPIVHPTVSGYPCADLCATAVAAKLASCLRAGAGVAALSDEPDLDLVALATVADVVPLRGENRRLVRAGLRALAGTDNPGLRALMAVARVEPARVDEQALGFRLAPRINAAGRLYRADLGLELLLCEDEQRAAAIAAELDRANAERRHTETRIVFEAEAQVAAQGEQAGYVLAGEGWHPGVIGIVASRLAERHHRPCVVIALPDAAARGPGTGSCRSIPGFDLLAGLDASSAHLVRHGGHRAAAGLQIEPDAVDDFRTAFVEHAASVLGPGDLAPVVHADAVISGADAGLELAEELARLAPFGSGNPPVALLIPCATFEDPVGFGGDARADHVRFTVRSGGARTRAVCFGAGAKLPAPGDVPLDAVFRLELNEWRGAVEPRLLVRHAAPCEPDPIELVGEERSFFGAVRTELTRALSDEPGEISAATMRTVCDRRGRGVAATIGELVYGGERVLVVAADARRRERHLRGRLGGFALCSHAALDAAPQLAAGYSHLVLLDPPPSSDVRARLLRGAPEQTTHLAWGEAELRFALQTYEQEYGLRASLTALFPVLRGLGRAEGEVLEAALRGTTAQPRSPALAGRTLRVLAELALVELDPERMTCSVRPGRCAELEGSAAFRAYQHRLEEGRAFLISAKAQAA